MADFREALKKGMEANERAKQAKIEMTFVLREAAVAISDIAGKAVDLAFEVVRRPVRSKSLAENLQLSDPPTTAVTVLRARTTMSHVDLADIEFGELGYPVSLRWSDQSLYAENGVDFEVGMTRLLGSAATGAAIAALVKAG
jgi:hypothetical protein